MEYLAEIPNQCDSQQAAKSLFCYLWTRGGLGLIGERRRSRIQLAATRSSLSNYPEVNDLVEPTKLKIPVASDQYQVLSVATENSSNLKIGLFQGRSARENLQIEPEVGFYITMVRAE